MLKFFFQANSIGRKFYSTYGFKPISEKVHPEIGHKLLQLKFTSNQST